MVRDFQANYVNMRGLLTAGTGVPQTTTLATPSQVQIQSLNLPAALTDAMTAYRAVDPSPLTPVKYMRTTNGNPDLVIEDDSLLPPEDQMVTFSLSVTTLSMKAVTIVTHVLVATTGSVAGSGGPAPQVA
jgi:hypothetical protein